MEETVVHLYRRAAVVHKNGLQRGKVRLDDIVQLLLPHRPAGKVLDHHQLPALFPIRGSRLLHALREVLGGLSVLADHGLG